MSEFDESIKGDKYYFINIASLLDSLHAAKSALPASNLAFAIRTRAIALVRIQP
jgi:hypothetical protein